MTTGDSEEAFRLLDVDCPEEVAAIGRAVKPLAGALGVRASIVASTRTIYHDGSVKAPHLAVAVRSSGVKVESDSHEQGHRFKLPSFGSFMEAVLHPFHRRFTILDHGFPPRTHKPFCALIHCAACGLIAATTWAGSETVEKVNPPLSQWLAADGITGDWDGMRSTLTDHGVEIFGSYATEVWGNTVGGLKQGAVYTGLLEFGANVDLEKLIGWKGASIHNNWFWLSGRDASEDLVGNFLTISSIAGFNTAAYGRVVVSAKPPG